MLQIYFVNSTPLLVGVVLFACFVLTTPITRFDCIFRLACYLIKPISAAQWDFSYLNSQPSDALHVDSFEVIGPPSTKYVICRAQTLSPLTPKWIAEDIAKARLVFGSITAQWTWHNQDPCQYLLSHKSLSYSLALRFMLLSPFKLAN